MITMPVPAKKYGHGRGKVSRREDEEPYDASGSDEVQEQANSGQQRNRQGKPS
jgi:hypothetical protein